MATKLYPDRQRCATCRKGFGLTVLERLYCSYKCAKRTPPPDDLMATPRGHRRQVNGEWKAKVPYLYDGDVPQKLRDDPATNIYLCDGNGGCYMYHVGHSRPNDPATKLTQEKSRQVKDAVEFGSVIERMRGTRTRKLIAAKAGVRPIRVKEVEEGTANLETAFTVARAVGLRIVLDFPLAK